MPDSQPSPAKPDPEEPSKPNVPVDGSRVESLYDRYLDAVLAGDAVRLSEFGEDAVWLEALHELASPGSAPGSNAKPHRRKIDAESDLPFETLGDYRLLERLGDGGMGVVYLAEQQQLGRLVALKVLRPELAGSRSAVTRFEREARAAARLQHPGIVSVHAFGTDKNVQFLAMDLLPGQNLDELIANHRRTHGTPLAIGRVLTIGIQIAEALQAAHDAGILHRDVKPSNVRILPGDRASLLDFGLARDLEGDAASLTGSFVGSPQYAAPEQAALNGKGRVDERTDIYGLGATLFECVCGQPPFDGDSVDQILVRVASDEPPAPRKLRPGLTRDFDVVLRKTLEKNPERRYASAAALADDLRAIAEFRTVTARPSRVWTKVGKAARRHPAWSTLVLTLVVIAATFGAWRWFSARSDRATARALIDTTREQLTIHDATRRTLVRSRFRRQMLERANQVRDLNPGERKRLAAMQAANTRYIRERAAIFEQAQHSLLRAGELDENAEGLEDAWAQFHYQSWLDVRSQEDPTRATEHVRQLKHFDTTGKWLERVHAAGAFSLQTEPSGLAIHLFQYARLVDVGIGTSPRVAAMRAAGAADPRTPGEWALRIIRPEEPIQATDVLLEFNGQPIEGTVLVASSDHPEITIGDRLVQLDGQPVREPPVLAPGRSYRLALTRPGRPTKTIALAPEHDPSLAFARPVDLVGQVELPARVWRNGQVIDLIVPKGVLARTTASPHLLCADRILATTPLEPRALAPGWYLAVLFAPGYETLRLPFHVDHPAEHYARCAALTAELWPVGTTPAGFVRIAADAFSWRDPSYFMAEAEVTCAEYLEFLRDAVRTASLQPDWWPKGEGIVDDNGTPRLSSPRDARYPVAGVSWHAARAYVDFLNRSNMAPTGYQFSLPTYIEWVRAGKGGDSRKFVFGAQSRPVWLGLQKYGAGERAPVLSHPVDESPYGVYDLAASVREWCLDEVQPGSGLRTLAGGSYRSLSANEFAIERIGVRPDEAPVDAGFRVVLIRPTPDRGQPR